MLHSTLRSCGLVLAALTIVACEPMAQGPTAWLDRPLDGDTLPLEPVTIVAHASDADGVARIEFFVNETVLGLVPTSGGRLAEGQAGWTPPLPGTYQIRARAVDNAGNNGPDAIALITVGEAIPTATPTVAAVPIEPPRVEPVSPPVEPTASATAPPSACVNAATLVEHVTIPPGTTVAAGQALNKVWRARNDGTCPWDSSYRLVFLTGEAMTTNTSLPVAPTQPGKTVELVAALTAPTKPGMHTGQWQLRGASGGFGPSLDVLINVQAAETSTPTATAPPPPPVCPGPPTIASFDASPSRITAGQSATLNWGKVENATSAEISPDIGGIGTPGSRVVSPARTTTYTLKASGCGGTTQRQTTITVDQPLPGVTIIPVIPIIPVLPVLDTTPPAISNVAASPNLLSQSGCGQNTTAAITARVTDSGGVNRVAAQLGDLGSGERVMSPTGGDMYSTSIGPFGSSGSVTIRIVASDKAGNTAQSGTITLGVACIK